MRSRWVLALLALTSVSAAGDTRIIFVDLATGSAAVLEPVATALYARRHFTPDSSRDQVLAPAVDTGRGLLEELRKCGASSSDQVTCMMVAKSAATYYEARHRAQDATPMLVSALQYVVAVAPSNMHRSASARLHTLGEIDASSAFDAITGQGLLSVEVLDAGCEELLLNGDSVTSPVPLLPGDLGLVSCVRDGIGYAQWVDGSKRIEFSVDSTSADNRRLMGLRQKQLSANPMVLRQLMSTHSASLALVAQPDGVFELWSVADTNSLPKLAARTDSRESNDIIAMVDGYLQEGTVNPKDLLGNQAPIPDEDAAKKKSQPWWVYAIVGGATASAAGVLLANELGSTRQRVTVRWQ